MSKHFKATMCHFPLATMELLSLYTGAEQTLAKVCVLFFFLAPPLLVAPSQALPLLPFRRQPLTMSWESYYILRSSNAFSPAQESQLNLYHTAKKPQSQAFICRLLQRHLKNYEGGKAIVNTLARISKEEGQRWKDNGYAMSVKYDFFSFLKCTKVEFIHLFF